MVISARVMTFVTNVVNVLFAGRVVRPRDEDEGLPIA